MAIHAGIFYFDGRQPPDHGDWDHCEPALAMRHRDDDVWTYGRLTSRTMRSPALAIAWDGRLDNREDLLQRLGAPTSPIADSEIALAAFSQLGVDGLQSLIGDWSLVIWDRSRRVLHLARDYMGARPLYYCRQ